MTLVHVSIVSKEIFVKQVSEILFEHSYIFIIGTSVCAGAPTSPDYRSELSSLVIVADVNALSTSSLSNTVPGITGVPITVILCRFILFSKLCMLYSCKEF